MAMAPSRDIGLMVFNVQPWRGWITYGAAIINGTGQNRADDNNAKDVVGRLSATVPTPAYSPSRTGTRKTRSDSPTSTVSVTDMLGKTTLSSSGISSRSDNDTPSFRG